MRAIGPPEILAALEKVLARSPNHLGANHYYIHAIQASREPQKGVPAADRLGALMPSAGHVVHMPAHIYQRVGRYADASEANRRAIVSDDRLNTNVPPIGYYPFYQAHNHGFLAFSASMLGKGAESLAAARQSARTMPRDIVCGMPGMDFFVAEPLFHARGMALASTGKPAEASADLAEIARIAEAIPADMISDLNSSRAIVELGGKIVEARIAETEKRPEALALWEEAVKLEDALSYSEPADWFYPTRHFLGAALLDAGKAKEAEAFYRADLQRNPRNGWALFGLWKALAAQKRVAEAQAAEKELRDAWRESDVTLTRSAW